VGGREEGGLQEDSSNLARVKPFKIQLSPLTQVGFPVTHKNKHILLKKFYSRMKIHIGIFQYACLMDENVKIAGS
jgi:hypothetical protein